MSRWIAPLLIFAVAGCARPKAAPVPPPPPVPKKTAPAPAAEPDKITVSHILIMFAGSTRSNATRSETEAEKLAKDILERAKKGQDFGFMMKEHSDDPGGGTYTMVNHGLSPGSQNEFRRGDMVPAFGNVGFRLKVGDVEVASYDKRSSPFGYHVIKRVK